MIIATHVYFLRLSTYTSVLNTDVSLAIGQVYNINMTKPIQMKISITRDTRPLPKIWKRTNLIKTSNWVVRGLCLCAYDLWPNPSLIEWSVIGNKPQHQDRNWPIEILWRDYSDVYKWQTMVFFCFYLVFSIVWYDLTQLFFQAWLLYWKWKSNPHHYTYHIYGTYIWYV